jgi:hypothetical protein
MLARCANCARRANQLVACPDRESSPFCKNISVFQKCKSGYKGCRPTPTKGRIMIVANAGWDAVDAGSVRHANACWTKTLIAYGEAVWS